MFTRQFRQQIQKNGIILTVTGVTSQDLLTLNIKYLKEKIDTLFAANAKIHNLFPVVIEMAQNIVNYSQSLGDSIEDLINQTTILMVAYDTEQGKFYIESSNLLLKESRNEITERINYINALSTEELKLFYKKMRQSGKKQHSKGAGLGFIYMAKLATESLQFEFDSYDDRFDYFMLRVYI